MKSEVEILEVIEIASVNRVGVQDYNNRFHFIA